MAFLAYVAGPYTQPDPVENTHNTCKFATALYEASDKRIVCVVPHISMLWHAITPMPYQDWLDIDLAVLERCDIVVRLAGYSSGADGEVAHARAMRIPVVEIPVGGTVEDYLGEILEVLALQPQILQV